MFQQKGDYKPRSAIQVNKLQLIQNKFKQEKLLGWVDEEEAIGNNKKGLRIVILKNLFTIEEAHKIPCFFADLKNDVLREIEENIGKVIRIKIYENNPEGVVELKFESPSDAESCIDKMNGRIYAGRKIECFFHDGKTDYKRVRYIQVKENQEQEKNRVEEFGKWIEEQSD